MGLAECCARPSSGSWTALLFTTFAALCPASTSAQDQNYTDKIPGTPTTFDMVYIPGGKFQMGSPDAEAGRDDDESPITAVDVAPFWIGKFEVTWIEYEAFWLSQQSGTEGADAVTRPSAAYEPPDHGWGRAKFPVMHLTWHAAVHYCRWLSLKTGHTYRLPTEAEWEYACRGGKTTAYSFGDDPAQAGDYAWCAANAGGKTHAVGEKKPNAFGLHDIHGNVWEYCLNPYTPKIGEGDPLEAWSKHGPIAEYDPVKGRSCEFCAAANRKHKAVLRGGSFKDQAPALRCANRQSPVPEWNERNPQRPPGPWWYTDGEMCGLRLARSVTDAKAAGNR